MSWSSSLVIEELMRLEDEMLTLCHEVRTVNPLYVYMEVIRRKSRGTISMRWRTPGRLGTSLAFDSHGMVSLLKSLPHGLGVAYMGWERRRFELNARSTVVCAHARNLLSQKTLKQLSLVA